MKKNDNWSLFIVSFFILSVFLIFYYPSLHFYNLTTEDAVTYLGAQGHDALGELSANFKHRGLWGAIIGNGKFASLDPGAYTVILHLWSRLHQSAFFLRIPGVFFFFLALIFWFKALKRHGVSPFLIMLFTIPFFKDTKIIHEIYTLRPYTMELAGASFLMFYFLFPPRNTREKLIFHLLLGLFIGSRYPLFLTTGIFYFYIIKIDSFKEWLKSAYPLFLFLPYYGLSLYFQLKNFHGGYHFTTFWDHEDVSVYEVFLKSPYLLCYLSLPVASFLGTKIDEDAKERRFIQILAWFFLVSLGLEFFDISPLNMITRYTLTFKFLALTSLVLSLNLCLGQVLIKECFLKVFSIFLLIFFFLDYQYFFKSSSRLPYVMDLISKIDQSKKVELYCDEESFFTVFFLKHIVRAPFEWSKIPECLKVTSLLKLSPGESYFLTSSPIETHYFSEDLSRFNERGARLDKVFGESFHSLYHVTDHE